MVVRGIGREQTVGVPTGYHLVTGSRAACLVPEDVWGVKLRPLPVLQIGLGARLGGSTQDVGFLMCMLSPAFRAVRFTPTL